MSDGPVSYEQWLQELLIDAPDWVIRQIADKFKEKDETIESLYQKINFLIDKKASLESEITSLEEEISDLEDSIL